jgi:hypothetical protein
MRSRENKRDSSEFARRGALLALLLAAAGCEVRPVGERPASPGATSPAALRAAPAFDSAAARFLSGADGVFSVDSYKGRPLLVALLGAGAYDTDRVVRDLNKICEESSADGVAIVGLLAAVGPDEDEAQAAAALNAIFPIARANAASLAALGGPRALPTYILVDRRGAVRKHLAGAVAPDEIRAQLRDLLADAR